jgi:O-methyltransferase
VTSAVRSRVRTLLRLLGYEIHRTPAPTTKYQKNMLYEADAIFHGLRARGLARTGSPDGGTKSIEKLYNTLQFMQLVRAADGAIAECGCYRGLSAFMFCQYLRGIQPTFDGTGVHVFDSFEGLSEPSASDRIGDPRAGAVGEVFRGPGAFRAALEEVRAGLSEFPGIEFHKGWIPACFEGLPERQYRFVHIDVDLYDPTRSSLEYFYPRLNPGGVIVCDDYAHLHWPGARKALDEYCQPRGIPVLGLTTGQGVIIKRGPA